METELDSSLTRFFRYAYTKRTSSVFLTALKKLEHLMQSRDSLEKFISENGIFYKMLQIYRRPIHLDSLLTHLSYMKDTSDSTLLTGYLVLVYQMALVMHFHKKSIQPVLRRIHQHKAFDPLRQRAGDLVMRLLEEFSLDWWLCWEASPAFSGFPHRPEYAASSILQETPSVQGTVESSLKRFQSKDGE